MTFQKGNKFGGKKKELFTKEHTREFPAVEAKSDYIPIQEMVDKAVKEQKNIKYRCKGCQRSLDKEPLAHLIDLCYSCVEKKQPGGVFTPQKYISGSNVKPTNTNENK